jgi:hypothetical protein
MRRLLTSLLLGGAALPALGQQLPPASFRMRPLSLPKELAYYDNQFSGLAIGGNEMYLMSESRLQDQAEAKLYALRLPDLDRKLRDTTYVLPYRKLPLLNLPALRARMSRAGQSYEGLEAMLIEQQTVYFTVETATPSTNCYLLRGTLRPNAVVLDSTFLLPLPKPQAPDGSHIYNAGYEALAAAGKRLFAFFEYNSFATNNVTEVNTQHLGSATVPTQVPFAPLPFRLTDITATGKQRYTAINFFFKGDGGDAVYRTPPSDVANDRLIRDAEGYKSYCRLISLDLQGNHFTWQPLWEFPEEYRGYNWEGLAAYKSGYFLLNDKYTPKKPYQSTLLYVEPAAR